jgi:hypothetical protein
MCLFAAIAALAPNHPRSRRLPRRLLPTRLWIACGMFLVRGFGNLLRTASVIGGGMPFKPLAGPDAQAGRQWLLIDAVLFLP